MRFYADLSLSSWAVASVEAIILGTRTCQGVVAKLSPSASTASWLGVSVLMLKLCITHLVGNLGVLCLISRRVNF